MSTSGVHHERVKDAGLVASQLITVLFLLQNSDCHHASAMWSKAENYLDQIEALLKRAKADAIAANEAANAPKVTA